MRIRGQPGETVEYDAVVGSVVLRDDDDRVLREQDGATLRFYGGPAPITRRSGKSWVVLMRRGCNERLRDVFYHWARVSTMCDPAARRYYTTQTFALAVTPMAAPFAASQTAGSASSCHGHAP